MKPSELDAERCIHQVFEAQAARTPDRIAVAFDDRRLSYRELNERSNQIAHHLQNLGVRPDVFVGICVDRTLELVVGILGILKAGGTYVPIDPQYPQERLTFMLTDSRAPIIVTQQALAAGLTVPAKVVCLDRDREEISRAATSNPLTEVRPENLAYVIYTSGSTGRPKGTLISHRNVVRLFGSTQGWFNFDEHDVWTLFHSCAFDFSVWELWGALFHGGKLIVVPFAVSRTPDDFRRLLSDEGVTVLNQTPSAFRQLVRADETAASGPALALRLVIFGGEALNFQSLEPWFRRHGDQRPQLVNMYGITETTVHVTYRRISRADTSGSSVIGVPIPDLQIHLLDPERHPVPRGQPGEIYVGGAGVARGYLNRPELTSQKFIPDVFSSNPQDRLYRSGDSARYLPNGDLEYLGRLDSQVKIRGYRIELGEISAAINTHASVRDSVVIVSEFVPGEPALVAYLVKRPEVAVNVPALRHLLRERLPEYMVPTAFVAVDRLPLTVNGKLDIAALPAPEAAPARAPSELLTGTAMERGIAAIWREVLKTPDVELDQNFFDIGGNSAHLAQVHERLQRLLGREVSITDLFTHSTVRALATHVAPQSGAGSAPSDASVRAGRLHSALAAQRRQRSGRR